MLAKLFGTNKLKRSSLVKPAVVACSAQQPPLPEPLKIVQAGGLVECYYMAVPAVSIMAKYPRSVLARPEIFHRPWEAVVRPDEILMPGEKFYIVPRGTVRKLQKRIRRPSPWLVAVGESKGESDFSCKSLTVKDGRGKTNMTELPGSGQTRKGSSVGRPVAKVRPQRRKKVRLVDAWQPSLVSIDESSPGTEVERP